MLYPKEIERKLGVDKIREMLKHYCLSPLGEGMVDQMSFSSDWKRNTRFLKQTNELKQILTSGEAFPNSNFLDVRSALKRAKVAGAYLFERELLDIRLSLEAVLKCRDFLSDREEAFPELYPLANMAMVSHAIPDMINTIVDKEGILRDSASPELGKIRKQIRQNQSRLRKMLDSIFTKARADGYIPDGASLTVRDGRMVIPVSAEHKRRIKGFIHDESSTGQTVFLEPTEALDINNSLRELEHSEKREIIKILTVATDRIREELPAIESSYRFLGLIDFIRAKAKFAIEIDAGLPEILPKPIVDWYGARHPLLQIAHKKIDKSVVPLHISFGEDHRILLISGPNAGGKSVCLKTVGLLQYMLQCGLLLPLDEHSKVGVFEDIFIDIGDEQSIENDLSTYSSHLTNMRYFLQHGAKKTLFLIDEFGTGTDPQFGGAIAESILQGLVERNMLGVVTTHYTNLKQYAEKTEGISNAAMRFDVEKLEPYYELEIGKPGSSFALEIAKKIGLPKLVIQNAKDLVGKTHTDFDRLLNQLEREKRIYSDKEKKITSEESKLRQLISDYQQKSNELETKKKDILDKAKDEAAKLLNDTNREIEKTIRHIKENRAQKQETKKVRERLGVLKEKVKREEKKVPQDNEVKVLSGEIKTGDMVRVKGQDVIGKVLGVRGKDIEVQIGVLKSNIKLARLEKVSRKEARGRLKDNNESKSLSMGGIDMNSKRANFSNRLDVRGKRAEEVIAIVDQYLDDAIMFGAQEVRVLHGKGDGILRDVIRRHLKGQSFIGTMGDEYVERGGAGITIITLK